MNNPWMTQAAWEKDMEDSIFGVPVTFWIQAVVLIDSLECLGVNLSRYHDTSWEFHGKAKP